MNQYKTKLLCLIIFCWYWPSEAQLQRSLKDSEISQLKSNIQKNPNNIRARMFLADHYYLNEQWPIVADLLSPVSERLNAYYQKRLSAALLHMGRSRDAHALVSTILNGKKLSADVYLLAIDIDSEIILKDINIPETAEAKKRLFETLAKAKSTDPQNVAVYEKWLQMLERHVSHPAHEAISVMDDMKKNGVSFAPKHYSLLCQYHSKAGYVDYAQISCEQASRIDPENPDNLIFLGQSLLNSGEEDKGRRMLASVGRKYKDSARAVHATALNYQDNKNYAQAYIFFKKATQINGGHDESFLGLGQTAFELRKYDEALNAFNEHCRRVDRVSQEFRRSTGLLQENSPWKDKYRQSMLDCRPPIKSNGG
jgi:tetratricopeptide (TPR) repeat protein